MARHHSKKRVLRSMIAQQKFDILGLAETWFRADARSHEFDCEGYKVGLYGLSVENVHNL